MTSILGKLSNKENSITNYNVPTTLMYIVQDAHFFSPNSQPNQTETF